MTITWRHAVRRQQIRDAAIAIIDEQGIQNLSLSEIEKKTGLARGQLMYYYESKEAILLAVFDRLLQMMHEQVAAGDGNGTACFLSEAGWERFRHFLTIILLQPPDCPAFHSLQYTFLSQIKHREDFRERLANLYGQWRVHMADDFHETARRKSPGRRASPRALATLVQAILHGLAMQSAADPNSYDRNEMLELILEILGGYLQPAEPATNGTVLPAAVKGKKRPASQPRGRRSTPVKKVNHAQPR
jgi:AcrR family transcriptional regulator